MSSADEDMSEELHDDRSDPLLRAVRFGAFELDVRAGELRKHGVRIRLQEQPFQVLLMLLERPGEVVLREEIRKKLWPNDTIVEFAPSINAAIQRLRDALGDSADQPRYVETVARRGYRFIGELLRDEAVLDPPPPPAGQMAVDVSDLTGHTISHYRVYEKLGRGGMGEVYRARDTKLGRDVALKVLPEEFAQDAGRMARFEREAHVLASLNHPNIAQIYGVEERALVMELVEGRTLQGPLPLETALNYATQIAEALAAAHEKGIVHRDLKPANVKVTSQGAVKVLDFGLAAVMPGSTPAADPTSLSTAGVILGTAAYMSPEQARGKPVDQRADIWAFGVVLYEMLTGRQAFRGETVTDVLAAVVTEEPDLTRVPAKARRLLQACLQKDPKQRLQAIGDWRLLLEDAPAVAERRYGRTIALAVAGACVLVVASVFVTRLWMPQAPSPSFQRLTFRRGLMFSGRFANGSRTIVYSASWDGNPFRLYSTQVENPESRDLGIANAHLLGVSPSGEMALAFRPDLNRFYDSNSGTLARAPISGGAPREVTENISAADWSSDGARLAVVRDNAGLSQLEFPIGNVLYQSTGVIGNPRISPKGDLIAFLDVPLENTVGSVAMVDLKGNKKTLTQIWLGALTGLVWSSSGNEILFTAAPYSITMSLYAVSRLGRQRLVAHLPGTFQIQDVAPDGRILFVRSVDSEMLAYLPTVDSKETDLAWHDLSEIHDISRDGKVLLFSEGGDATRSGEDFVSYLRRTDGSAAVRLGLGYPLEISPDGKWAMVLASTRVPAQLVLLPTGTGEARPLTHDGINHQGAAWTPDGKRIVFVGNEPGHRIRYYVQSLAGGLPRAITPENVSFSDSDPVVISPDSRFVAVTRSDGKISLQALDGDADRIPKLMDGLKPLRWCPDNRSLLVYHSGDVPVKILRVDIETGEQALWKEWAPGNRSGLQAFTTIRVGADCHSSAYSVVYSVSDLWIADGLR